MAARGLGGVYGFGGEDHWKGWTLKLIYIKLITFRKQNTEHRTHNTEHITQNTEHRTQKTEHRSQITDTHVHKITNLAAFLYGAWTFDDFDAGKSITRVIGRGGPENLDFQGPPLSMALVIDLARIKIITSNAV
jgi:hypothetical protein